MARPEVVCTHCGRCCGDYAGGTASVQGFPVCHPNEPGRPDCYTLVTVHGQRLGMLLRPKPGDCDVREVSGRRITLCGRPAVAEETIVDNGCPDDPDTKPRELTLRYCEEHEHRAATPSERAAADELTRLGQDLKLPEGPTEP